MGEYQPRASSIDQWRRRSTPLLQRAVDGLEKFSVTVNDATEKIRRKIAPFAALQGPIMEAVRANSAAMKDIRSRFILDSTEPGSEKIEMKLPDELKRAIDDSAAKIVGDSQLENMILRSRNMRLAAEAVSPHYGLDRKLLKIAIEAISSPPPIFLGLGDLYSLGEVLYGYEFWPTWKVKLDGVDRAATLIASFIPVVGGSLLRKTARIVRVQLEDKVVDMIEKRRNQQKTEELSSMVPAQATS